MDSNPSIAPDPKGHQCQKHGTYLWPPGLECPRCVIEERDRLMRALVHIRANAESQLHSQAFAGTPEDAPEAITARWNYTEASAALTGWRDVEGSGIRRENGGLVNDLP